MLRLDVQYGEADADWAAQLLQEGALLTLLELCLLRRLHLHLLQLALQLECEHGHLNGVLFFDALLLRIDIALRGNFRLLEELLLDETQALHLPDVDGPLGSVSTLLGKFAPEHPHFLDHHGPPLLDVRRKGRLFPVHGDVDDLWQLLLGARGRRHD